MVSLRSSSSRASSLSNASRDSRTNSIININVPLSSFSNSSLSSGSASSSSSSSQQSLDQGDEENITITANHSQVGKRRGKRKSQEDLQFLAVSTHITELSYSISDIQTRIFEIQELRHKSQSASDATSATNTIDQSLMNLDERLESVAQGIKSVSEALKPLLSQTQTGDSLSGEEGVILRKHAALTTEWEAVQSESETLRDELKEDKWLIVFRTVTEQAGGLMTSLEKGVNRCQDFISQVHQRRSEDSSKRDSLRSEKALPNLESYMALMQSYDAKKKHYVPAITKVLSVLDKGAQDRVTKNGECLRRHAESTQRWKNLRDRIKRTDDDLERVRKYLQNDDLATSETGSNTSGITSRLQNGYLGASLAGTNSSGSKAKTSSTLSRSISPFRKLARRIKGSPKELTTPIAQPVPKRSPSRLQPSSEPAQTLHHRSSMFIRGQTPVTPERQGHKHSFSMNPEASPFLNSRSQDSEPTLKGRPRWNGSTRVEPIDASGTIKQQRPSISSVIAPLNSGTMTTSTSGGSPYSRSISRTSMASSRPWSPVNSSGASTTQSSLFNRPPSRMRPSSRLSQTTRAPSRAQVQPIPSLPVSPPRSRPKTPSSIPAPSTQWRQTEDDGDSNYSFSQRAFSPTFSASSSFSISGRETPSNSLVPAPRPPSRSMIPIPSLKISAASRPSSVTSNYSESPENSFRRSQTPEFALHQRVMQLPVYQDARATPRPSLSKLPPSSFRDGTSVLLKTPASRPGSRAALNSPGESNNAHVYTPVSPRDPLDAEVARIVNSIPHGLLIERVDPPLKAAPKDGEEVRAQYAFANALARKVTTCRLTTLTRLAPKGSGQDPTTTKKVMCRVGGGWQDLQLYILNR